MAVSSDPSRASPRRSLPAACIPTASTGSRRLCLCGLFLLVVVASVPVAAAGPPVGAGAGDASGGPAGTSNPANETAGATSPDLRSIERGQFRSGTVDAGDPTRDNPRGNVHEGVWNYEPVSFAGEAGEVVHLSLYAPVDTSAVLLGPRGDRVADNEDGGPGDASELLVRLPEDGTYTLQVTSHYPNATFDYALEMHGHDEHAQDRSSIAVGERAIGTVDPDDPPSERFGGFQESLAFDGTAGQNVTLAATAWVDAALTLRDPDGDVLAREVAPSSGRDARLAATLPSNGTYTVDVASGDGDARFAYQLAVVPTDAVDDSVSVAGQRDAGVRSIADGHETTSPGPVVSLVDHELNRSVVRVGEAVETSVAVANVGDATGAFETTLSVDRVEGSAGADETSTLRATVPAHSVERLSTTTSFSEPGRYRLRVGTETAGTVTVVDPAAADGNAVAVDDGVLGVPSAFDSGGQDSVALDSAGGDGPVTITELTLSPESADPIWFEARQGPVPPASAPPLASSNVTYLALSDVDRGRTAGTLDGVDSATATVEVAPEAVDEPAAVTVYELDAAANAWRRAQTELISETDAALTYRATVDRPRALAVATNEAPLSRTATVDASDGVVVRTRLANDGSAPVEHTLTLSTANRSITSERVTLAPGETATLSLDVPRLGSGRHRLRVDGAVVGTVDETDWTAAGSAETTESGGGFGPLAPLWAVLALSLARVYHRGYDE